MHACAHIHTHAHTELSCENFAMEQAVMCVRVCIMFAQLSMGRYTPTRITDLLTQITTAMSRWQMWIVD